MVVGVGDEGEGLCKAGGGEREKGENGCLLARTCVLSLRRPGRRFFAPPARLSCHPGV